MHIEIISRKVRHDCVLCDFCVHVVSQHDLCVRLTAMAMCGKTYFTRHSACYLQRAWEAQVLTNHFITCLPKAAGRGLELSEQIMHKRTAERALQAHLNSVLGPFSFLDLACTPRLSNSALALTTSWVVNLNHISSGQPKPHLEWSTYTTSWVVNLNHATATPEGAWHGLRKT